MGGAGAAERCCPSQPAEGARVHPHPKGSGGDEAAGFGNLRSMLSTGSARGLPGQRCLLGGCEVCHPKVPNCLKLVHLNFDIWLQTEQNHSFAVQGDVLGPASSLWVSLTEHGQQHYRPYWVSLRLIKNCWLARQCCFGGRFDRYMHYCRGYRSFFFVWLFLVGLLMLQPVDSWMKNVYVILYFDVMWGMKKLFM